MKCCRRKICDSLKLRIIHINDVYTLENLPRLKSFVEAMPGIVTMGGDFLAPYLLSSLDHGAGMVDVLNALPTHYAILGNHESDIPFAALEERMREFRGTWINSNFPIFASTVKYDVLNGYAVIGLLCDGVYRDSSFNGQTAKIRDPVEAARELCSKLEMPVIALTHLDLEDDLRLTTIPNLIAILGGHDHDIVDVEANGTKILKSGMDATHAAVLEISDVLDARIVDLKDWPLHQGTQRLVDKHMLKVKVLDNMVLTSLDAPLSSKEARTGECSMATMLCTVLKCELDCDCAILEGGSVRANADYDRVFTFGHLKRELPFVNATGIAAIQGRHLNRIMQESRAKPGPSFLHLDADCHMERELLRVNKKKLVQDKVYSVAVGLDLGFGSQVNQAMLEYARQFPQRIPKLETAIPATNLILAYFAQCFWRRLPAFDDLCAKGHNFVSHDDVYLAYTTAFEVDDQAASNMVRELIVALDANADGKITRDEYDRLFSRHKRRRAYSSIACRRASNPTFYIEDDAPRRASAEGEASGK